ncbi:hypothetical protein Scep_003063 [Stephania cephalantha]|uniref:Uncharacterized protein n=1 Tax=Stephania cephalantha TaxID=152367 RepID=A0AAP0PW01_9MAGN
MSATTLYVQHMYKHLLSAIDMQGHCRGKERVGFETLGGGGGEDEEAVVLEGVEVEAVEMVAAVAFLN